MKIKILISYILSAVPLLCSQSLLATGAIQVKQTYVSSDYAKTKYPIVFAHGMFGFNRLGSSAFGIDYWYQILPNLARNGSIAFATQVSPLNSTEVRGEQLLGQVDEILAVTGAPKVNLFGHSHGGPSSQYIEAVAPDKVSSVTAIAGSMQGAEFADTILKNNLLSTIFKPTFNLIGNIETLLANNSNLPNDSQASLNSLNTLGSATFNAKYTSAAVPLNCNISNSGQKLTNNGVYHYSWTGNKQITNFLDVLDTSIIAISTTSLMGPAKNDGILSLCTSNYGQVIRNDYNLNHFDEVNQVLGLKSLFAPDPVALFRQHANRLKLQGL